DRGGALAENDRGWTDQRMEVLIGSLLRGGVLLSAIVVSCGAAVYLVRHGHSPTSYRTFQEEPPNLRSVSGVFRETFALRGRGIIQLGLLLLIATPVARVAFAIFGFAEEHDRLYVIVASIVLLILLYSLVGSALSG
ncbi:MAG: DUF1634 domain-containing protein, partial [Candidatus Sulfotelmatobacter sp.]